MKRFRLKEPFHAMGRGRPCLRVKPGTRLDSEINSAASRMRSVGSQLHQPLVHKVNDQSDTKTDYPIAMHNRQYHLFSSLFLKEDIVVRIDS